MINSLLSVFFNVMLFSMLAVGPALAQAPAPAPKTLMVFGDSLVAGYGLPLEDAFPAQLEKKLQADGHNIRVINAGVSGDTTSAGLTRLEWSLSQKPDYLIVELGANDMLRQIDRKVTIANLSTIVKTARDRDIPVLVAGMRSYRNLNGLGAGLEKIYEDVADEHDVLLYPFFLEGVAMDAKLNLDDGMHPNKQGVAKIVEGIYPTVLELIGE